MTVGLLICDHVDDVYQPKFGDYPSMFRNLFPEFEFTEYDVVNGEFPEDLDAHKVYMASGSRFSAYEDLPWIDKLKELIQELHKSKKCFIGYCFGHQILAEALGGKVEKSEDGWCVGILDFTPTSKESWMRPDTEKLNLLMMCQDQVVELPENAKLLAGSPQCPVGMFAIDNRMLGIQAHPEFEEEYDRLLINNRVDRIGADMVSEGLRSFNQEVDQELIYDWIINFINNYDE